MTHIPIGRDWETLRNHTKLLVIHSDQLCELLTWMRDPTKSVSIPQPPEYPADIIILSMHRDPTRPNSFELWIAHESFPEVAQFACIPTEYCDETWLIKHNFIWKHDEESMKSVEQKCHDLISAAFPPNGPANQFNIAAMADLLATMLPPEKKTTDQEVLNVTGNYARFRNEAGELQNVYIFQCSGCDQPAMIDWTETDRPHECPACKSMLCIVPSIVRDLAEELSEEQHGHLPPPTPGGIDSADEES